MSKDENVVVEVVEEEEGKEEVKKTKTVEMVPVGIGPIKLLVTPKVAKGLKVVGAVTLAGGCALIGSKVGGAKVAKKKDMVIRSQSAEIDRLQSIIDTPTPVSLPETATHIDVDSSVAAE